MIAAATKTARQIIPDIIPLSIFERLAGNDRTAIKDCIHAYGSLIWALARKFTASTKEAEAMTEKIFVDIWRYAQHATKAPVNEKVLIALIARRRLSKRFPPNEIIDKS